MSLSDNEEALFDDIYGDDDVQEETKTTATTEDEVKLESKAGDETKNEDSEAKEEKPNTGDDKDDGNSETERVSSGNQVQGEQTQQVPPPPQQQQQPQQPQQQQQQQGQYSQDDSYQSQSAAEAKRKADLSREGGKMFIGGLDWDTDEDRLKEYFSQYGEVVEHTIMREASTGRSRGFGFLTFADSKSVQEVLKTQHVLDGKVIDPKRSIPREEQDKTGKIFVGGIAPEVRPHEYEAFFSKFGTIIDAQLMLDKDTGKSRGFGFITFDSSEAVDRVCQGRYLDFNGKQIEVKRAEPRGPQQQQNHIASQQHRYLQQGNYGNRQNQSRGPPAGVPAIPVAPQQNYYGVTPEAMNEYYQSMTQYWAQLQQQGGQAAQFAQYAQQLQQFQQQQQQQGGNPAGNTQQQDASAPPQPPVQDAPINAPRGPRGGSRGGRGRGYSRHGGNYHPYQR
jgi:RNA-binding protein Musashi